MTKEYFLNRRNGERSIFSQGSDLHSDPPSLPEGSSFFS